MDAATRARASAQEGVPQRLGRMDIIEPIGEGGMARISLARTRGIGGFEKLVVVKQILPRLAEDAEFIARFFQEARLAATLDHPNIAAVYDVDEADGAYFYAMEYVRGRDLQKVIWRARRRERPLSFDEIVTIVVGLCAGLHHAHVRTDPQGRPLGIVHRDVSPSNVLISFEGAVKLTDFGVAKARTGMVTTAAGTLRGKIAYMSPEQCNGEALDRRSDVYAVGVLLWELITGQRLHTADNEIALLREIADHDAPSPCSQRPDCPPELERIAARALARSPVQRYASAEALAVDLEQLARRSKLSVSSRVLADLMSELFAGEQAADEQTRRAPATVPIAPAALRSNATPATGTLAPIPAEDTSEQIAIARPARRGMALVVGVAIGVVIGGGGLFVALDRGSRSPDPDPTPNVTPVAAPTPAERSPREDPTPPAPPHTAPTPTLAPPPPPTEPAAESPTTSEAPPKRKAKRRRKKTKRELDLDSALPPGFDAE
jgi:serine/threonine protein kinase